MRTLVGSIELSSTSQTQMLLQEESLVVYSSPSKLNILVIKSLLKWVGMTQNGSTQSPYDFIGSFEKVLFHQRSM